jgi:hypothetical protein
MTLRQIQETVDRLDIYDARIMEITSRFFEDELLIRLAYSPGNRFDRLVFKGCTKIDLQHRHGYQKLFSVNEYFLSKTPCNVRHIQTSFIENDDGRLMQFNLDLHPLEVLVVCRGFTVTNRAGETHFSVQSEQDQRKYPNISLTDAG